MHDESPIPRQHKIVHKIEGLLTGRRFHPRHDDDDNDK